MRLLKNMENFCSNIYSVKKAICNMNLSVLQEVWILLGGCLTVKNQWEVNHTIQSVTKTFLA